jgi:hypothetical protein
MSNNFANRALLASGAFAAALAVQNALPAAAAELPRDHITLPETISVDITNGTVTLPLYRGTAHGRAAYYIITEASSAAEATRLRVSFAPSISGTHTQNATGSAGSLAFNGAPDFSPARVYTPSASGFPPAGAAPGAVGDAAYSPFVKLADGTTLDAPIVATGDAADTTTHTDTGDRVLAISADKKTVTILLAQGFFNGSRVVYLSTEASDPGVAAIERATYVKSLNASAASSEAPIVALANGQTGASNTQAQGLAHLALDGNLSHDATLANAPSDGSPLNVLATFNAGPSAAAYTPLWAASVGLWSPAAIAAHRDVQLKGLGDVFAAAGKGDLTAPDGKAFGPSGFVVNCPIVGYVDKAPF